MTTSNVDSLLEALSPLVDERAGVVARVDPLPLPLEYHDLIHGFQASVGDARRLHPARIDASSSDSYAGYGTAFEAPLARVRAICEALERYSALMRPVLDARTQSTCGHGRLGFAEPGPEVCMATQRELGESALDTRRLPRCSTEERRRARPEHRLEEPELDRPIEWVRGWSVTRGRPLWVPMTATYLGLPLGIDRHLVYPMSTGFAAGTSYAQALLAALCEVIERDSLALWWLQQLPFPRLARDRASSPPLERLLRRRAEDGVETSFFDLTTDVGVPVIGLVQTSRASRPHVITMAACRPRAAQAMARVAEEAESLRIALSRPLEEREVLSGAALRASVARGDPHSADSFGLCYAGPDAVERFRFALDAEVTGAPAPDLEDSAALEGVLERLARLGMEVIAVDVTAPELRDFGVVVVKAIVPELMPITFSHAVRYLGHPRLYEAPKKLGYGARSEASITEDPIPYA